MDTAPARCANARCQRPLPAWDMPRIICDGCQAIADTALRELPALYAELPTQLLPGRRGPAAATIRRAAGPRDLINWDIDALLDEVPAQLGEWVADWAEQTGQARPGPGVAQVCGWLRWHLDWAARQHIAAADFMLEVRELCGRVRVAATGERGERAVRRACPCGGVIPWRVSQDRYRCGGCTTIYGREEAAALPAAPRKRAAA